NIDGMERLVDHSLVRRVDQAEARFTPLETVREFALEELEASGELEVVQQRHLAFYLAWSEAAAPFLMSGQRRPWLDQFAVEHDNLRTALSSALAVPGGGATARRLAAALFWFWYLRGHLSEGRRWLERALAAE